ncbi:MAG: spermidine synthase [Janthinobacterium lividum]
MTRNCFNKYLNKYLITFVFVTSILLGLTCRYAEAEIIYHNTNEFGPLWVKQNGNDRYLTFSATNDLITQSFIKLDAPSIVQLDYIKMILGGLLLKSKYNDILVLGLGGGTIPAALNKLLPNNRIDIAEINPLMVKVAQDFFNFKPNKNTNIYIVDGYKFIKKSVPEKYDLIFLDAFNKDYIPAQFLTTEFIDILKKCLKPGGVVAVNTFANTQFYETESNLYNNGFGKILNIDDTYNRIIFAVKGNMPSIDQISENAKKWSFSLYSIGIDTDWLIQKIAASIGETASQ